MMDKKELEKIKGELISQIDSWHASDEQKQQAKQQMKEMPDDKFEEFLVKNNVVKRGQEECPFCMIKDGKLSNYKIGEDKNAIAVLEINPLSKGHVIVVPRKHEGGKPGEDVSKFAQQISSILRQKLKPIDVKNYASQIQGHTVINVVPDYGEKQERKKASPEDLENIQKAILKQEEVLSQKAPELKEKKKELPKFKMRIP